MNRRSFLKLLAASLGAAGVSMSTISWAFPEETSKRQHPERMKMAEALKRLARRYADASYEQKGAISLRALRIMAEGHRDYGAVWAGGGVSYWLMLADEAACAHLVRKARENRNERHIGPFLANLREILLSDRPKEAIKYMHETRAACAEMAGVTIIDVYINESHGRPLHDLYELRELKEHWPDLYEQDIAPALRNNPAL